MQGRQETMVLFSEKPSAPQREEGSILASRQILRSDAHYIHIIAHSHTSDHLTSLPYSVLDWRKSHQNNHGLATHGCLGRHRRWRCHGHASPPTNLGLHVLAEQKGEEGR
jgi:hypothetical protein